MKYRFDNIENGTLEHGVTIVTILNHEAEIDNADADAALLAEQHGGVLVTQAGKPPKDPETYKARLTKEKGDVSNDS